MPLLLWLHVTLFVRVLVRRISRRFDLLQLQLCLTLIVGVLVRGAPGRFNLLWPLFLLPQLKLRLLLLLLLLLLPLLLMLPVLLVLLLLLVLGPLGRVFNFPRIFEIGCPKEAVGD